MPKLTVDGVEVEVPAGATVLQACEAAGAEIPRFCYHERLSIAGNCRMCLVDVSPGPPKPQASCALPAADGQVVSTTSARTKKAQQGAMEFLLINHPLDCPICDQGGECDLQDQALAYGRGHTRYHENKRAVTEKYMGPLIKTVMTRCIHCTRCVRFAEEVAGVEDIGAIGRGENMQITSYLEGAVRSELSGNVIDLCPVGALTSKPYAFEARPWELKKTESIDVMDAVGTNIVVATRGTAVMRVTPRINDDVNEEWASDVTRFAVDGLQRGRLDAPYVRVGGKLTKTTWAAAFDAVRGVLAGVAGEDVAAVAGDLADVEAMVALKDLLGQLGSTRHECRVDGMVTAGAHPSHYRLNSGLTGIETADVVVIVGSDVRHEAPLVNTRIRKLRRAGRTVFNVGPAFDLTYPVVQLGNDAGLLAAVPEALADALGKAERPAVIVGSAVPADVLAAVMALVSQYNLVRDGWNGMNLLHTAASRVGALDIGFVSDGGMAALTEKPAKVLFNLGVDEVDVPGGFRIYLGHHGDRGARAADVILPAAAYTEKSGTYVNLEGRVQRGLRATFPPGEAREDWTILRALSAIVGTPLPYDDLRALRARIAAEWPHLGQEGLTPVPWVASEPVETAAPSGPIEVPVRDFYRPNAIARASATMAACVAEIVDADEPALEAAE